jgi:hypothetical protein
MMASPYAGRPESEWLDITRRLIASHPLGESLLRDAAIGAWASLWRTRIGSGAASVEIADLRVPATVVGYFFEVLLARELEHRQPNLWRGNWSKEEKDLVYIPDPSMSVEVKTSGQAGFKIYGNRSYGQKVENELLAKKEKSGYYITVNFHNQDLTLIRFGWIDAEDWDPQKAPTGQMAGLRDAVYRYKLIPISGAYRRATPIQLLDRVGPARARQFESLGIRTIGDLLDFRDGLPPALELIRTKNLRLLEGSTDC